jgi:hypothetical protein
MNPLNTISMISFSYAINSIPPIKAMFSIISLLNLILWTAIETHIITTKITTKNGLPNT